MRGRRRPGRAGRGRIGIDEISYKKGNKYLTVVVCHDTGRLVWVAPGRSKATPGANAEGWAGHARTRLPGPPATRHAPREDSRYALWKNPEDLTDKQTAKLAWIAHTDPKLHRAYLLTEGLRTVFKLPHTQACDALDRWISWARHCRIPPFVKLQKTIVKQRDRILAAIEHSLSNGRIESVNTKIRLITRIAFGCRNTDCLTARAVLTLGGQGPTLPART